MFCFSLLNTFKFLFLLPLGKLWFRFTGLLCNKEGGLYPQRGQEEEQIKNKSPETQRVTGMAELDGAKSSVMQGWLPGETDSQTVGEMKMS